MIVMIVVPYLNRFRAFFGEYSESCLVDINIFHGSRPHVELDHVRISVGKCEIYVKHRVSGIRVSPFPSVHFLGAEEW